MKYNFWFFYITGIISAFISLFTKQKKVLQLITVICIFFIMSSCIPSTAMWNDLNNYAVNFNSMSKFLPIELSNDWAYYNGMYLCKLLGMSFMKAKATMLGFALICFLISIRNFTHSEIGFVLLFYLLHLIFNYNLILRNSIGFSVLMLGIDGIVKPETKHGTLKFIVFTIIAAQFHSMLYLYFPLAVVNLKWEDAKKYKKVIIATLILVIIGLIVAVRAGVLVSFFASMMGEAIGSEKYSHYAVARGRYAWLSILLIWIATVVNAIYVGKMVEDDNPVVSCRTHKIIDRFLIISNEETNIKTWLRHIQILLIICSLYIPLTIFTLHLARVLKYISILNVIYMAMIYENTNGKRRAYIFISTLVISLLWMYFDMNIYGGYDAQILKDYVVDGRWFWK